MENSSTTGSGQNNTISSTTGGYVAQASITSGNVAQANAANTTNTTNTTNMIKCCVY